jgi:hypothetical protein
MMYVERCFVSNSIFPQLSLLVLEIISNDLHITLYFQGSMY